MKKIIGIAALLAGTAGMFALPAAAEGRRTTYTAPAYTQTYNNGYSNGYANNSYYANRYDSRDDHDRGRDRDRDFQRVRHVDRDDWR